MGKFNLYRMIVDNSAIEIEFKRVNEWLLDRKKVPKDWNKRLKALHLKLEQLLDSFQLDNPQIREYVTRNRDSFDFLCLRTLCDMLLRTDEAKQKTLFGQYSSTLITQWLALRTLYQKDSLHIADMGRAMAQNTSFEIPALKRNIISNETAIHEIHMKVADARSNAKTAERDYENHCQRLGIKGESVAREVALLTSKLPELYADIVSSLKNQEIGELIQYYKRFSKFSLLGKDIEVPLPLLEYFQKYNDDLVALYQSRNQGKETEELLKQNERRYEKYAAIASEVPIDIEALPMELPVIETIEAGSGGIDWGITLEESSDNKKEDKPAENFTKWEDFIILDDEPKKDDNAKGGESQISAPTGDTLLADIEFRNLLIGEINELLYFIKHRIHESKQSDGNSLFQVYAHSETGDIFDISEDKLKTWLKVVENPLNLLTSYKIRSLFIMKDSPKNRQRICDELMRYKTLARKQEENARALLRKIDDLESQNKTLRANLEEMTKHTTALKVAVEADMKTLIKRDVVITGEVNKLIK
eukprot:TRINITY_DN2264_c0_g1_i1.p1 TRINITY_DN2264_c0_g1~~TRINITY_DN2264_c0_g1_i1.p1  ORF type:complete len:540 (+),score=155.07 TRINITY_DN2264_c0_g1_i1:25-1620(+)